MPYPRRPIYRRCPRPQSGPTFPVFKCTAELAQPMQTRQGEMLPLGSIMDVAFWPDGGHTLSRSSASASAFKMAARRPPGARTVYYSGKIFIFTTVEQDISDASERFLTDEAIDAICSPPKSFLDSLLPIEEQLSNFQSFVDELYIRACDTGLVKIDDVESDYAKLQKITNLAVGAATAGERRASLVAARGILRKLAGRAL